MRGIRPLCDHTATLYRESVTRDAAGDTVRSWVARSGPSGKNCRPNDSWAGSLQDGGPGLIQGARRQWFLVAEMAPEERDILRVTAGPEAPLLLKVVSVSSPTDHRQRIHHHEVNVEAWSGSLS